MPLIYQKVIFRDDLQNNPKVLYVFGDNVERWGLKGQAKEMRGEPNAIGVATKWAPNNKAESFFSDRSYYPIMEIIRADMQPVIQALNDGRTVIWPADGIGSGLSNLEQNAPKVWQNLGKALNHLELLHTK
jgi:hypothetical protein